MTLGSKMWIFLGVLAFVGSWLPSTCVEIFKTQARTATWHIFTYVFFIIENWLTLMICYLPPLTSTSKNQQTCDTVYKTNMDPSNKTWWCFFQFHSNFVGVHIVFNHFCWCRVTFFVVLFSQFGLVQMFGPLKFVCFFGWKIHHSGLGAMASFRVWCWPRIFQKDEADKETCFIMRQILFSGLKESPI